VRGPFAARVFCVLHDVIFVAPGCLPSGASALRKSLATRLAANSFAASSDEVLVTTGAAGAVAAVRAGAGPGDAAVGGRSDWAWNSRHAAWPPIDVCSDPDGGFCQGRSARIDSGGCRPSTCPADDSDRLAAGLPAASLLINATRLGKDQAGLTCAAEATRGLRVAVHNDSGRLTWPN